MGRLSHAVNLSLTGDRELRRKLDRLPNDIQAKLGRLALKQGAKPIIRQIRQNLGTIRMSKKRRREFAAAGLPMGFTGNLRKSIGDRMRKYRHMLVLVIGPRWPKGAHGHIVEYGTAPRFTKDGVSRGKMPAFGFMRKAWDARWRGAAETIRRTLWNGLKTEATKP